MTFNLEMWTKLRKSDLECLERIQSKALKQMFNLPQGTPYWGILAETGIMANTVSHRIPQVDVLPKSTD